MSADARIAVLVITDGRDDYLLRTVRSAMANLAGPITEWWMFDDTGDYVYRDSLVRRWPTFNHIEAGARQGFGGAIRAAWAHLVERSTADFVFHLEADFVFNRRVDLAELAGVLAVRPHLAQMALVRQAWNATEIAAGGLIQCAPHAYTANRVGPHRWLEHTLFWTTNPSLYRASMLTGGWPDGHQSEGMFTRRLLELGTPEVPGPRVRFGYWGSINDGPWVEHIGIERTGHGY